MNIPDNLRYTHDHEWICPDGDFAVAGITDFAQGELGDVVFIEIGTLGEKLTKGAIFGTVEAVKTVSDLFMPVSGEVVEVNELINDKPELVNTDPYGDGWMIRLKMADETELSGLLSADEYQKMIES